MQAISSDFRNQHVGLGNTKLWRWVSKPTSVPKANGFASQWIIGLRNTVSFMDAGDTYINAELCNTSYCIQIIMSKII